jgi:hypothetical protein
MQVDQPVCCGIDVHKDTRTACLRCVDANGQVSKAGRALATTSTSLLAFADWLVEQHGPVAARESPGVYTPPGILPKGYWSGNMALRLRVPACSCARKSSVTPRLTTPYHPTKAPVRQVQEYRMAKPSSQRRPPPEVPVMFEPHRLQDDVLQTVYTLLVRPALER